MEFLVTNFITRSTLLENNYLEVLSDNTLMVKVRDGDLDMLGDNDLDQDHDRDRGGPEFTMKNYNGDIIIRKK